MHHTITETFKTLSDDISNLISTYDDKTDCVNLCRALDAVQSMAETTDKGFDLMNDALYDHIDR